MIGSNVKKALFAFEGPCGQTVKIADQWFTVIGVATYKSVGKSRVSGLRVPQLNNQVFLPFTIASYFEPERERGARPDVSVDEIVLGAASSRQVPSLATVTARMIRRLHGQRDDFTLVVPQALLAQSKRTQRTFNIVMGAIAGISLLVGGIGIMNIMLATVLERRHEIGVRRASGATCRAVMLQFLVEAVALSLLGCIVGIILGIGLSAVVGRYAAWRTTVNMLHILAAVGVACLVGVLSGYYPARRAARLDPGEALRYE